MKFRQKLKNIFWGDDEIASKYSTSKSTLFTILACFSVALFLVSNIIANKSFAIGNPNWFWGWGLSLPCAVILYPATLMISDLLSEIFGFRNSRKVAYIAFAANLIMVLFFILTDIMPGTDSIFESSFHTVLGLSQGLGTLGTLIASALSFFIGSLVDDLIFEKFRKKQNAHNSSKGFYLRANVSTFFSQLVDSAIFIPLLYLFLDLFGVMSIFMAGSQILITILSIIMVQALVKTLWEIIALPLITFVLNKARKRELDFQSKEI